MKEIKMKMLAMVLALGLILVFCVSSGFAEESLTISTYYPSPYGSYNELQTNRLAVGDTNGDGSLGATDQPPADGQLYTARSVIYKPLGSLPATNTRAGELAYLSSDDSLYLNNGAIWVKQGAGGGCYVSYNNSCLGGFTNMGAVGSYGLCSLRYLGITYFVHRPPGSSCDSSWNHSTSGTAYVCCK